MGYGNLDRAALLRMSEDERAAYFDGERQRVMDDHAARQRFWAGATRLAWTAGFVFAYVVVLWGR